MSARPSGGVMYCPECGDKLKEIRDLREFWAEAYRCRGQESQTFLKVIDQRWVYSPLALERGVAEAIEDADEETLRLAFSRIKRIDYKTISIVSFEYTLLGCYDPDREYRVVYPDGSEA